MLNRLGRDVAVYGGADLLFKLLQFAALPLYSHRLSVAEFGLLALVTVSAMLAGVIVNLGVSYSVSRFYFDRDIGEARRPVLVSTGLVQLMLTGVVILLGLGAILHSQQDLLVDRYELPWALVAIALLTVLPDQVAQYSLDTARLQFAPWRFCLIALVKNVLGLLIGLWLLFDRDLGVLGLLAGNLAAACLAAPLGLWLIRRDLTLRVDPAYLSMLIRFGSPFVFTTAAYWLFASIDRWLLAELADPVQVGLFSIALKFASIMALVITAFHQAWIPIAMKMAQEDPGYRQAYATILEAWLFLLAVLALGLSLFARDLMTLLTPQAYWPAAGALAIGAAAIAVSGTTQVTCLGLTLEKRTRLIAVGAWLAAGVNIACNLALIPPLGATGSAIATFLTYLFLTSYYLRHGQRLHPIPLRWDRLGYGMAIVTLALLAPLLPPAPVLDPWSIAWKIGVMAIVVSGGVWIELVPPSLLRLVRLEGRRAQ